MNLESPAGQFVSWAILGAATVYVVAATWFVSAGAFSVIRQAWQWMVQP